MQTKPARVISGSYLLKSFVEGRDKIERFILAAKARAKSAQHEKSPKLTALEKGMWDALKRAERPVSHDKAA